MLNALVKFPGYEIEELIYNGSRTLVYKGFRDSDQKPVAIKVLKNPYPSASELVQFCHQYTITKNLSISGIIQPYSLEKYDNGYALVMEDGGISLKDWVRSSTEEFLQIAIQIVCILSDLYRDRIIHKDIKPANILINPATKQVKLIDFSIASLLPKETQSLKSFNILEGTLAYISPEQTGRMNRGIDYRSDYYSLGVTFYELLTGELPFQSDDPMELVYSHIAKQPPAIATNPALSKIVSKLMAKNAEDRYQSATAIKHDLEICLHSLRKTGTIPNFEIGEKDFCDRFIIPEKLYGRQAEVRSLLAAFDRISGLMGSGEWGVGNGEEINPSSRSELMLVAGFSGIGKTAVVNEIHKPIVRQRGYFIKGKFDQYQRNIPFSAFVQAFRNLIDCIITESNAQVKQWKQQILEALGDRAGVIVQVIPELENIIGQQPPVSELSGTSAQNRFNLLFENFIKVFAKKEHPLVIFLDDLQWADSASLKLMQLLMSDRNSQHLLLIGAYRDNEVFSTHPLMLTVEKIRQNDVLVNQITLLPLTQPDVNHLLADTLKYDLEKTLSLTELIYQKTQGNPFYTSQFIKSLHEEGLIYFDFSFGSWQYDIEQIQGLKNPLDVVEFMKCQLQKLPKNTQKVLQLAACLGNTFELKYLSLVCGKLESETAAELSQALQEGFILPISENYKIYQDVVRDLHHQLPITSSLVTSYKFLHDRVQQAAYLLIPEHQKQNIHLQIGQLLLKNLTPEGIEENIFDIVNHLNIGCELIDQLEEKNELAQLNLTAGRKARISTAYGAAIAYFNAGIKLLGTASWTRNYSLTLALHEEAAEVAYLNGDYESVDITVEIVLQQAKTPLEQVKVREVKILAYASGSQQQQAINFLLPFLKLLGVEFSEVPSHSEIQQEFEQINSVLSYLVG